MIDACKSNNVKLGIAYYRHFYPAVNRIKELIRTGELGTVSLAQINAFEWHEIDLEGPRGWVHRKTESGGGPMMGFGCHRLEVLINILGPIRKASGYINNVLFDWEVEDNSAALLHFDSGSCGVLCVSNSIAEPGDTLDVYGSKGSVHIHTLNKGGMVIRTSSGERREEHPPHPNLQLPLIGDFAEAVLNNREPGVGGEIGYGVQKIEEEIYTGAKTAK